MHRVYINLILLIKSVCSFYFYSFRLHLIVHSLDVLIFNVSLERSVRWECAFPFEKLVLCVTFHISHEAIAVAFNSRMWESNLSRCISYVTFRMHVAFLCVCLLFLPWDLGFFVSINSHFYLKTNFQTHLKRSTVCDWTFSD